MAETTDHPQVPPDAVMSEKALAAPPPAPAETYQPLSLLAMAGFGLVVLYTLAVLIGGAISFMSRVPWLMPFWTFLVPLAVLIVCRAARTRILNSEGTLSGLAFTAWGSRLAILFSIPYAAYYIATFLAVRGQAIDCANEFFQRIKNGQLEQAFLSSQDIPVKGASSAELRDKIESRFNQTGPGMMASVGKFTQFRQERFARFVEMDGGQASTGPTGVAVWEYTKGGYRVVLNYHVATSLVEFDMKVETFGRDPKPGEPKGRQWLVLLMRGETDVIRDSLKLTPRGVQFEQMTAKVQNFARDWVDKVSDVDALTPAERESYSKLIRGYDTFWAANKKLHDDIAQRIRNTFQPSHGGKRPSFKLVLQSTGIPLLRESDGRTTAWIDVALRYFEEGLGIPRYVVNARLVLSTDSSAAADSPPVWRVDAIEIESGRTAPETRRMQKAMAGPTTEEAGLDNGQGQGPANPPPRLPPPPPP